MHPKIGPHGRGDCQRGPEGKGLQRLGTHLPIFTWAGTSLMNGTAQIIVDLNTQNPRIFTLFRHGWSRTLPKFFSEDGL